MKFLQTFVIGLLAKRIFGLDNQDLSQNKSKRALIAQTQYYGDVPTIQLLHSPTNLDFAGNAPSQLPGVLQDSTNTPKTLILHSSNIPVKTSFDLSSRSPQVFYEYQQAPNTALSNIHLEHKPAQLDSEAGQGYGFQAALPTKINPQFTQPHHSQSPPQHLPPQPEQNNQFGIVTPVQHSTVIHHGPGFSRFLYSPLPLHNPSSTTPPSVVPPQGRYNYANGRIQLQQPPNYPNHQPYPGVTAPTKAHNLFVNPSPIYPPPNYNRYHAPKPLQQFRPSPQVPNAYYRVNTPVPPIQNQPRPVKEEEEEEQVEREDERQRAPPKEEAREREEAAEEEEEDEGEEEERRPRYRNKENSRKDEEESEEEYDDEEDRPTKSGRYYNDDEDDERSRYRNSEESQEEEDDADGEGNTRYSKFTKRKRYSRYPKSQPKKRNQSYKEYNRKSKGYSKRKSYSDHYEFPSVLRDQAKDETKFSERENNDPKNRVKTYYYTASSYKPTNSENGEKGKAENPPVVGLKSFREENWIVTKKIEE